MAVRKEVGDLVVITAGKTYGLRSSVKDMAGNESSGVEELMARVFEEALSEVKEGEKIEEVSSGFFTKNMTTHFWVVLVLRKKDEVSSGSVSASHGAEC